MSPYRLAGALTANLSGSRDRPPDEVAHPSLSAAARYEHVSILGQVPSQNSLFVEGFWEGGNRNLLVVDVAHMESEVTCDA